MEAHTKIQKRSKKLSGTVVSDKMKDTAVVLIERFVKHAKYGKYYKTRKRYKAHDPNNAHKVGSEVVIEECKPFSKDKHFRIIPS